MNVIIDTSVWFEYFKGNEPYFSIAQDLLDTLDVRIIDPIVGEILQGALNLNDMRFLRNNLQYIPKTEIVQLFEKAGEYSFRNKLLSKGIGLIDAAIIYATIESGSVVWTLDNKILNYMDEKNLFQTE